MEEEEVVEEVVLVWDGGGDGVLVVEEVEEQGDGVWEAVERDTPCDGEDGAGGGEAGDHGRDISGGEGEAEVGGLRRNNHSHRSQMETELLASQSG